MKDQCKILLNYSAFRKNYLAGVAVYAKEMLFEIMKQDDVNRYTILINKEVKNYFEIPKFKNIEVIYLGKWIKVQVLRVIFEIFILPFIVITKNIGLIFTPYVSTSIFSPCKKITVIHDIMPLLIQKYSILRQKYVKSMMYLSMKFSTKIITVSENSKKDLIKFYPKFKNKVSFIYNGVSKFKNLSDSDSGSKLNKYPFKYILFVGTLQPSKNLIRLISAFGKIHNGIDEKLIIVGGKGWQVNDDLISLIKEYNLSSKIVFAGYVEFSELVALYKNASFLVYPSLYEGFGFPPLEAMQYGTAVLASDQGSIPEVCGDAALYVNPYDIDDLANKIYELSKNNEYKSKLVQKGFIQVEKFDWCRSAEELIKNFDELIKNKIGIMI